MARGVKLPAPKNITAEEIADLQEQYQEPIRLWALGQKYEDAAGALGISVGTFKSRTSRARKMIRKARVAQAAEQGVG